MPDQNQDQVRNNHDQILNQYVNTNEEQLKQFVNIHVEKQENQNQFVNIRRRTRTNLWFFYCYNLKAQNMH